MSADIGVPAEEHAKKVLAARIASLKDTPAWDDLTKVLLEYEENYWRRVMLAMRTGRERAKPVDQREIDYSRGLSDGIRRLLEAPEKYARIYERYNEEETS